jgi:hypothetical protein
MKIVFTHHAIEKKTERNDWLIRTKKYHDTRTMMPKLESLLRDKGKWYACEEEDDGIVRFYCIVNQLEVYCGIGVNDEIIITTYYPYTKKVKRRLFPRGKTSFERFFMA